MPETTPRSRSTRSVADDRGTGLFGSLFGLAAFMALLLLAVQLLASLYATSVVTGVAYDAAKQVATGAAGPDEAAAAARRMLGASGDRAVLVWTLDADRVALHVTVAGPRVLAAAVGDVLPFATIERTVTLRREQLR